MHSAATLQAKRRELVAAYAAARTRHTRSAGIARRLVHTTCNVLKAEIREEREAAKAPSAQQDLFAQAFPALGAAA